MSRLIFSFMLALLMSASVFAQDLALKGFNERFQLVKNTEGRVTAIKLKKVVNYFTIRPFIEQIKSDLLNEQHSLNGLSYFEQEAEIDQLLLDLGIDPYMKLTEGQEEAEKIKESLQIIKDINVEAAFNELNQAGFWKEFEAKLNEAFLFIDPTIMANLDDARFFFKRQTTFAVVNWALDQAKQRFSNVPVLNIASFVIVRVHDMMMDQRHFHHNLLLHYFETIPETKLGMTKEEVDRSVSSIYEYRIGFANLPVSNQAARDWPNFGMNNFYTQVRAGNGKIKSWQVPGTRVGFQDIKKLNFAFAEVTEANVRKIYHLHTNAHSLSSKPALAYDFSNPARVKTNRALLNLAGVAIGFVQMPGWLKSNVISFIESFYIQQVRMEGALVGHFETTGNSEMIRKIFAQRANFYILN